MRREQVELRLNARPPRSEFEALWQAAWGSSLAADPGALWDRSLAHLCAYAGPRLVGYVNLAWDGGIHAFLLDTTVHPEFRRRGIATRLVQAAAETARGRGAEWLHVDYEPHLEPLYRRCGFGPTAAGLMRL